MDAPLRAMRINAGLGFTTSSIAIALLALTTFVPPPKLLQPPATAAATLPSLRRLLSTQP